MKKKYEAPAYDVITYSLHEAIAGGCDNLAFNNHSQENCESTYIGDLIIGKGGNFAEDTCETGVGGYCYFTSGTLIFNS